MWRDDPFTAVTVRRLDDGPRRGRHEGRLRDGPARRGGAAPRPSPAALRASWASCPSSRRSAPATGRWPPAERACSATRPSCLSRPTWACCSAAGRAVGRDRDRGGPGPRRGGGSRRQPGAIPAGDPPGPGRLEEEIDTGAGATRPSAGSPGPTTSTSAWSPRGRLAVQRARPGRLGVRAASPRLDGGRGLRPGRGRGPRPPRRPWLAEHPPGAPDGIPGRGLPARQRPPAGERAWRTRTPAPMAARPGGS